MFHNSRSTLLTMSAMLVLLAFVSIQADGQVFDQLFNTSNRNGEVQGGGFRKVMSDMMSSVNVPAIYDMAKNGTSLGINVLSGLVKVERGEEAARNGLVGRRPLSQQVRIFGIPVYERGQRIRPVNPSSGDDDVGTVDPNGYEPKVSDGDADKLPIDP